MCVESVDVVVLRFADCGGQKHLEPYKQRCGPANKDLEYYTPQHFAQLLLVFLLHSKARNRFMQIPCPT